MPDGNEPVQAKSFSATARYVRFGIDSTYEGANSDWMGGLGEVRFEGVRISAGTVFVFE